MISLGIKPNDTYSEYDTTKSSFITLNMRISFLRGKKKSSHKSKWQRFTLWAEGHEWDAVKQEQGDFSRHWWRKWLFLSLLVNLKIGGIRCMFWFFSLVPWVSSGKLYRTHFRKWCEFQIHNCTLSSPCEVCATRKEVSTGLTEL